MKWEIARILSLLQLTSVLPFDTGEAACANGDRASTPPSCAAGPEAGGAGGCASGAAASSRCLPGAAAGAKCDVGTGYE